MDLASRLKNLRSKKKLSLRALAELTGFSASFLSQVELGQASPSLSSLAKIAQALGQTLPELLTEDASSAQPTVRRKGSASLRSQWSLASVQSLLPAGASTALGVVLVSLEPGGRSGKLPAPASGHELAFCVRGQLKLTLGETVHELTDGDSIYYDASQPRLWENTWPEGAELLLVMVTA